MADREQPYDPYIPSNGQGGGQQQPGNQRTAALQAVCGTSPPSRFPVSTVGDGHQNVGA